MKVYGITGGAGTGKSEVIKMLQQNFGGCVIMSDEVARELMQKGNISYQLIVEYFGRDILLRLDISWCCGLFCRARQTCCLSSSSLQLFLIKDFRSIPFS